jgi:hypothetical protein
MKLTVLEKLLSALGCSTVLIPAALDSNLCSRDQQAFGQTAGIARNMAHLWTALGEDTIDWLRHLATFSKKMQHSDSVMKTLK